MIDRIATDMDAELERDTDRMAAQLQHGDLAASGAEVPESEFPQLLKDVWVNKPDARMELADSRTPEDFIWTVLNHMTDLSETTKQDFFKMLEGGIPYEEAMTYAQQIHDAEMAYRNPLQNLPPMLQQPTYPTPPLLPVEPAAMAMPGPMPPAPPAPPLGPPMPPMMPPPGVM